MEIDLELRWRVNVDGETVEIDELLFALLRGVARAGQLNSVAIAEGVSYRHAWGLLRKWEQRLGSPLLVAKQGRGATLTKFASGLLDARAETEKTLERGLSEKALRASAIIERALESDRRGVRIASSHDEVVLKIRENLEAENRLVSLEILGSEGALRQYRRGDADLAGFHLPIGELGRVVAPHLIGFLDEKNDEIFLVEHRILGLMSRHDQPCRVIEALITEQLRFVNRQAGSATRLTFDALLASGDFAPGGIVGYHDEEHTHTAVAALVVSKDADVAFGSKAAAEHFELVFEPMVEERFYLVASRRSDSGLRQFLAEFSGDLALKDAKKTKSDEYRPTVAVMKRVHNAGFWKKV